MPRRLLYGITGGIAAYKAPLIIREFQKRDVIVNVVVTNNALKFVTSTTLSAICGQPVYCDMFQEDGRYDHLELARWAEVLLVAPATANCLAKLAWGVADDLLSTMFIALNRPVLVAPAMNHDMWVQDVTQKNVGMLENRGVHVVHPDSGYLACVEEGAGRMAEVETIVEKTMLRFEQKSVLQGKRVLVTAGATREHIDPIRFMSNRSSGKMGFALANVFLKHGAQVTLVSGPTELIPPIEVEYIRVISAAQMFDAVAARAADADIIVKAAAVADYTPAETASKKIKKTEGGRTLELVRTRDILKYLGENKKPDQILIGFSAETDNHLENAASKLKSKNLDMIVLNDVAASDAGFQVDKNRVIIIQPADKSAMPDEKAKGTLKSSETDGFAFSYEAFPLMSKILVAEEIVDKTIRIFQK